MKQHLFTTLLLAASTMTALAQKTVYIPNEWRYFGSDTLLYKESDPDGLYTWSKTRSVESDNVIIFWDKYYKSNPKELSRNDFYYVDIDDLLNKCEAFFDLEINQLGFVDPATSNLSKYKVMVLMNHTTTWTCYGGGYDYQVSALWLNPSTCKPVGHSVAHEVGHSFHYMCYAEHSGHKDSSTDGTGFHLPVGSGQAIWEQTAQWQAAQSFPELMFSQSYPIFRYTHNYAFSHEWHRYQSYWFHYFLCQYYDDITTVAQVWNQPMTGAVDFNQSLMALKGLTPRQLYQLYFDYACRCVTWDIETCKPYATSHVGDFEYRCALMDDGSYQVALASCPQGTGFNVIPLQVPAAGTEVKMSLTGLSMGAALHDLDPGEYYNGDSRYVTADRRYYVNGGQRNARGFRMGFVALMNDGSRQYFAQDSVYCQGSRDVTEDYSFVVPGGVKRLWMVIAPALKTYHQHKWDEKIDQDDMWPYKFRLDGTDIGDGTRVYAAPTIDSRDIADATFTYDITMPEMTTANYNIVSLAVSGRVYATLGTALQTQPTAIADRLQTWTASGPANGMMMFYANNPDGTLAQSGSTANGYGHWFDAGGNVTNYGSGYVFSEFNANTLTFSIGQYPNRCQAGKTYTIAQTIRYRKRNSYANATFVFNITIGDDSSLSLRSIDYADPTAEGIGTPTPPQRSHNGNTKVYDLSGRRTGTPHKSINIIGGHKVLK